MTIACAIANDTPTQIASELAAVALELQRCTVQVRGRRMSTGSGVIWHPDGLIITNAHVAQDERSAVELSDGRVFDAIRTSIDPKRDLAALRVDATNLPAATVGNSDTLRVGELVLAVGNPQGVFGALTTGIIHEIDSTETKVRQKWVIADVRLAPGNSGGPLANARGQVIGINTMIVGGLALAVPSNEVERFLKGGSRPYLGVTMRPVQVLFENRRILGLLVLEVAQSSPATAAGLMFGDVIIGACGQWFNTPDDLLNVLEHTEPSEPLPLEFLRNGKRSHCTVVLRGSSNVAPHISALV
jgi:serine protease Do